MDEDFCVVVWRDLANNIMTERAIYGGPSFDRTVENFFHLNGTPFQILSDYIIEIVPVF